MGHGARQTVSAARTTPTAYAAVPEPLAARVQGEFSTSVLLTPIATSRMAIAMLATTPTPPPVYEKGFFCKAAWCSEGSVCCENGSDGLCGSPGTTCCESPGGVLNLCAPGSYCNHENGHCSA